MLVVRSGHRVGAPRLLTGSFGRQCGRSGRRRARGGRGAAAEPAGTLAQGQHDVGAGERGVRRPAGRRARRWRAAGPWRGRTWRTGSRSWSMVPRGSFSAPPGTKPLPARACEVFPAAPCTPGGVAHQHPHVGRLHARRRRAGGAGAGAAVAGGAVVVVGMGAWPRSTASTASASGCLTSQEGTDGVAHLPRQRLERRPAARALESPRNACTSWLNAGRSKRGVGGEVRDHLVGEVGRDHRVVDGLGDRDARRAS